MNPYCYTKRMFEHALQASSAAHGVRFVAVRYFNAAGADTNGGIGEMRRSSSFWRAAEVRPVLDILGDDHPSRDGTCLRNYICVSDLARAQ